MQQISVTKLNELIQSGDTPLLIDVREADEHNAFNIGGILIPLSEIIQKANQIPTNKPVIMYCRKGIRSQIAIQRLEMKFGYTNLLNLTGGMDAWQLEL